MRVIVAGGSGRAGRYAVRELDEAGHEAFLTAAADTCLDTPLGEAIERHYGPRAQYEPGFGETQSAFDCRKIERFFGRKAQYSWRDQG